jgi:hypothetical protein
VSLQQYLRAEYRARLQKKHTTVIKRGVRMDPVRARICINLETEEEQMTLGVREDENTLLEVLKNKSDRRKNLWETQCIP